MRLLGDLRGPPAGEEDEDEELTAAEWAPPAGQSGDGRTVLNAKLGY